MKYSFLFAFDSSYSQQGCVAIYSLLENIDNEIEIYVILDETNKDFIFPEKIVSHKNLIKLNKKYIDTVDKFYNVEGTHISKATFYRLYLSELFTENIENMVYLDADVVCLNSPLDNLSQTFELMKKQNLHFGFSDELKRHQYEEPFNRLKMKNNNYFNAGVMLFSLKKWKEYRYTEKSINLLKELKNKAKFWDQDVLNAMIDGNYYSIDKMLNYKSAEIEREQTKQLINDKKIKFLHYSGKGKPWEIGGLFEEAGIEYHKYFYEIYGTKFHVTTKNKKNSIYRLFKHRNAFKKINFFDLLIYFYLSIKKLLLG